MKVTSEYDKLLHFLVQSYYECSNCVIELFTDLKVFDPEYFHKCCADLQIKLTSYTSFHISSLMVGLLGSFDKFGALVG